MEDKMEVSIMSALCTMKGIGVINFGIWRMPVTMSSSKGWTAKAAQVVT